MNPCSTRRANLRRTVVRERIFSKKSCFSVSGCPCSSAYPISTTISKSTMDLRKGSCFLSNSLIFFNPVNNFMVFIVFIVDSVGMVWLNYRAGKSNWVPFWHLQDCRRLCDNRTCGGLDQRRCSRSAGRIAGVCRSDLTVRDEGLAVEFRGVYPTRCATRLVTSLLSPWRPLDRSHHFVHHGVSPNVK